MERGLPSRSSPSHRNRRLLSPIAIAVCTCMYIRITMCVYVCVRVCTYCYVCVCVCMYVYVCSHEQLYTHTAHTPQTHSILYCTHIIHTHTIQHCTRDKVVPGDVDRLLARGGFRSIASGMAREAQRTRRDRRTLLEAALQSRIRALDP